MSLEGREPRKKYRDREYASHDTAKITLIKDKKTVYSLTIKPSKTGKEWTNINRMRRNPNKIRFGVINKGNSRIELCAYKQTIKEDPNMVNPEIRDTSKPLRKVNPNTFLVFVNGEYINLDIDDYRKLYRILNRVGHFFGILGRKKAKKHPKKR